MSVSCRQVLLWGLAAVLLSSAAGAATFRPGAAVLPFHNTSMYSGHLLGRRAADQLALELGATGVWRVVDRAQTDQALEQRGLRPPYAVGYLQELGHALQADVIFTGTVQRLDVDKKTGGIRMTVFVEAVDQVSGQAVQAVTKTAEVRRNDRTPEPTDVLIGRSLAGVLAEVAVATGKYTGIIGEVAEPGDGTTVKLKLPENSGVETGFRFLLYRAVTEGEERVPQKLLASVMITKVSGTQADARVLARGGDIHSGDVAVSMCCEPKAGRNVGP